MLSLRCAEEARQAVLSHFKASSDYTVVFTPNASAALKLIGESYPFSEGGCLVIGADSHNSVRDLNCVVFYMIMLIIHNQVNGIRQFASHGGAQTVYIPSTLHGGFDTIWAEASSCHISNLSKFISHPSRTVKGYSAEASTPFTRFGAQLICDDWAIQRLQQQECYVHRIACCITWLSYYGGRSCTCPNLPD